MVEGPPVAALTSASNTTAATQQAAALTQNTNNQPSVMIVEIIGYGGGDGGSSPQNDKRNDRTENTYDPNSSFQLIGNGALTEGQRHDLTEDKRRNSIRSMLAVHYSWWVG